MKFLELTVFHRRGRSGHQAQSAAGLWKGNHIPKTGRPGQDCNDPVKAKGDAAVRRSSEPEGLEKEPEFRRRLFGGNPEYPKHSFLDLPLVNPDASAADLLTVQNQIVGLRTYG